MNVAAKRMLREMVDEAAAHGSVATTQPHHAALPNV
jgi:hypothetical protein